MEAEQLQLIIDLLLVCSCAFAAYMGFQAGSAR